MMSLSMQWVPKHDRSFNSGGWKSGDWRLSQRWLARASGGKCPMHRHLWHDEQRYMWCRPIEDMQGLRVFGRDCYQPPRVVAWVYTPVFPSLSSSQLRFCSLLVSCDFCMVCDKFACFVQLYADTSRAQWLDIWIATTSVLFWFLLTITLYHAT